MMDLKKLLPCLFLAFLFCANGFSQKAKPFNAANRPRNLADTALLELVQKQTFRYFWDFAHPVSGLSRERSNNSFDYGGEVVTSGGT
ncbi:MAG TPA: beta-glucosidase, partial [Flavisolibacter sp.]|nr:beta-glucosidase [Flavisolibacter sp.]